MKILPSKTKKELQAFLEIIYYLSKFCPSTADICELFRKLTSARTEWTWNATYQKIFNKAKSIIIMNIKHTIKCALILIWIYM